MLLGSEIISQYLPKYPSSQLSVRPGVKGRCSSNFICLNKCLACSFHGVDPRESLTAHMGPSFQDYSLPMTVRSLQPRAEASKDPSHMCEPNPGVRSRVGMALGVTPSMLRIDAETRCSAQGTHLGAQVNNSPFKEEMEGGQ